MWDDITLPWAQTSDREHANTYANTQLTPMQRSETTAKKQEASLQDNKSESPPWNSLGAKPKNN